MADLRQKWSDNDDSSDEEQRNDVVLYEKLSPWAMSPKRATSGAAGFDLYAAQDTVIKGHGGYGMCSTDLSLQLPEGTYGRVASRSGLALNQGINVGAGVIDRDYEGNVGVVLFNHGDEDLTVQPGDRIAQLVVERAYMGPAIEKKKKKKGKKTCGLSLKSRQQRGAAGFGSTGLSSFTIGDGDDDTLSLPPMPEEESERMIEMMRRPGDGVSTVDLSLDEINLNSGGGVNPNIQGLAAGQEKPTKRRNRPKPLSLVATVTSTDHFPTDPDYVMPPMVTTSAPSDGRRPFVPLTASGWIARLGRDQVEMAAQRQAYLASVQNAGNVEAAVASVANAASRTYGRLSRSAGRVRRQRAIVVDEEERRQIQETAAEEAAAAVNDIEEAVLFDRAFRCEVHATPEECDCVVGHNNN